jgi:hypothetical protein
MPMPPNPAQNHPLRLIGRILNSFVGENYSPGLLCMMPPSAKMVVAVI